MSAGFASTAALAGLVATASSAEVVDCVLSDGTALSFAIERAQFSPAIDAREPPKINTTIVQMGGTRFAAEPFLLADTRGFWGETPQGARVMFVVHGDRSAVYADLSSNLRKDGRCNIH